VWGEGGGQRRRNRSSILSQKTITSALKKSARAETRLTKDKRRNTNYHKEGRKRPKNGGKKKSIFYLKLRQEGQGCFTEGKRGLVGRKEKKKKKDRQEEEKVILIWYLG